MDRLIAAILNVGEASHSGQAIYVVLLVIQLSMCTNTCQVGGIFVINCVFRQLPKLRFNRTGHNFLNIATM